MAGDPALALQGAINVRLRSQVTAVSNRVYDAVPQKVVFPYLAIGEIQSLDDGATCIDAAEVFVTLHVWSRAKGSVEARTIAGVCRTALHEWKPVLTGFDCVELMHRDTRVFRDADGETTHGVLTFRALIDAAE